MVKNYHSCHNADIKNHEMHTSEEYEMQTKHQEEQKGDVNHNSTEDIFTDIGLGRWHILPILIAFLYQAASPTQLIGSVFTNIPLDYKCVSITDNTSTYDNVSITENTSTYDNVSITDNTSTYDNVSITENTSTYDNICKDSEDLIISCSKFEFNHTVFKSTFTTEFELICDKSWISNLYQVSVTIGLSIGSLLGGIGDRWGRLAVIRVGALGCLVGVLLVGFGPNVYLILVGRLLTGLFCNILNVSSFTLAIENIPTNQRSMMSIFIIVGYQISTILLGIISYFLQYWRMLHLAISCYIYLIVVLIFFIDESPRWLFQNGQIEEGIALLNKIIKLHKSNKKVTDFSNFIDECKQKDKLKERNTKEHNPCIKLKQNISVFFKNPAMISISITTPIIWFITGLVYFGVPLNAHNFTDNPFIYMVLIGVVEIIGIILGGIVLVKFGNIRTCAVLFGTTGSCFLFILPVPEQIWWLKWILILIAMMSISVCYTICYIMASELYPTEVRATGLGICTFSCFMGFILSSMLSETVSKYSGWVFHLICSASCFIAVMLIVCLLPETRGEPLCETAEDVAERRKKLWNKT
ncbi:unnamed protein product [Meganyctiphanes norvegica]|uniref:Major facilitator superfamily (MFS) profile domain-containing protein n=1 Tax=Meganyctiphanes norvegica TaxID=48144 RepID=A0AAV2QPH3_MEGNR